MLCAIIYYLYLKIFYLAFLYLNKCLFRLEFLVFFFCVFLLFIYSWCLFAVSCEKRKKIFCRQSNFSQRIVFVISCVCAMFFPSCFDSPVAAIPFFSHQVYPGFLLQRFSHLQTFKRCIHLNNETQVYTQTSFTRNKQKQIKTKTKIIQRKKKIRGPTNVHRQD